MANVNQELVEKYLNAHDVYVRIGVRKQIQALPDRGRGTFVEIKKRLELIHGR